MKTLKQLKNCCALSLKGVFYRVLRENVNAERYLDLLQSSFIPFLQKRGEIEDAWLMHDGGRPHTANTVLNYLLKIFDERVISNLYPNRHQRGFN